MKLATVLLKYLHVNLAILSRFVSRNGSKIKLKCCSPQI